MLWAYELILYPKLYILTQLQGMERRQQTCLRRIHIQEIRAADKGVWARIGVVRWRTGG